MSCAKFGVDWSRNVGGVGKKRHLVAGMSGFGYLSSGAGPGSSHAIGVSAPFTVWAVGPLLAREV